MDKFPRGKVLIINVQFKKKYGLQRKGTDVDKVNMEKLWTEFGFQAEVYSDEDDEDSNFTAEVCKWTIMLSPLALGTTQKSLLWQWELVCAQAKSITVAQILTKPDRGGQGGGGDAENYPL